MPKKTPKPLPLDLMPRDCAASTDPDKQVYFILDRLVKLDDFGHSDFFKATSLQENLTILQRNGCVSLPDVFQKIPAIIANPENQDRIRYGVHSKYDDSQPKPFDQEQAADLERRFNHYTFAQEPDARDAFFDALVVFSEIDNSTSRYGYKHGKQIAKKMRHALKHILNQSPFSEVEAFETIEEDTTKITNFEVGYNDIKEVPWYAFLSLEGRTDMHQRKRHINDISISLTNQAGTTFRHLLQLGDQYRAAYIAERAEARAATA